MTDSCCESACGSDLAKADPRWRRILWVALAVNALMFIVEMIAGATADSRALQADALDFLGDAANYGRFCDSLARASSAHDIPFHAWFCCLGVGKRCRCFYEWHGP